jgi:hypothetical protein
MLETVRIRRAGYNVRLTYEEFIQLYRILLPKGLLSSQKDVRDFMNHFMDLNKQHFQLGITKIYMRENQKMKLDIRLHTKIIESIVCIQRWFRSILQRRKFLQQRHAVVTIQSNWRMCLAQKHVQFQRARMNGAAITIQAAMKMYLARKKYEKFRRSVILLQAHIRGKLARTRIQQNMKLKHMRERQKLRSTQSLPVHEPPQFEPGKRMRTPTPHYSLEAEIELFDESPSHRLTKQRRDQMLNKTEEQIRNLLINERKVSVPIIDPFLSYQPPSTTDGSSMMYDVEKASRRSEDDTSSLKRFDVTKMPIRRVDSGPIRRENRFESAVRPKPATDVEIVLVNPQPNPVPPRAGPYNQQYSLETLPQRRDIVCRSLNEDYHSMQPPIVYHQPQIPAPQGKAAALLGTINESAPKHKKESEPKRIGENKRSKNAVSHDEISTGAVHFGKNQHKIERRMSDPANKVPLLEVNRGNDLYQSSTNINIGGHRFRKVTRISKAERCASCDESDSFISEGHRCLDCKILVHTKCIQNGGIKSIKCGANAKRSTKRGRQTPAGTPNSKFSGAKQYTDSTDKIISDAKELQLMQDFITQKICKMEGDKVSEVDRVFKQALREFKDNLVAQYSVAHKQNSDTLNIKYRDLITNFEAVIETACGSTDDFPKTMGVNAFRGFMNEFMNSRETEKPKAKRKKEKKRKAEEQIHYNGEILNLFLTKEFFNERWEGCNFV